MLHTGGVSMLEAVGDPHLIFGRKFVKIQLQA